MQEETSCRRLGPTPQPRFVDLVKFNNSGDSFCYPQVSGDINPMTEDEVRAICETTLNLGRRLCAHAHADAGVRQCIKYGVEFIHRAPFCSDAKPSASSRSAAPR